MNLDNLRFALSLWHFPFNGVGTSLTLQIPQDPCKDEDESISLHFCLEGACSIQVYPVLPARKDKEQTSVMFGVFSGHLGLSFDVNGCSAGNLRACARSFQGSVKSSWVWNRTRLPLGGFLCLDNASGFHEDLVFSLS